MSYKFFIQDPPLNRVVLNFILTKDIKVNISKGNEIYEEIKEVYKEEPDLVLNPLNSQRFHLSSGGGLLFSDNEKRNLINIGQNYIEFVYSDYIKWEDLLPEFLNHFLKISNILELEEISKMKITYLNEFNFPKENFHLNEWFNLDLSTKYNWNIWPNDIFIGIVPYFEDNVKCVLRLKGIGEKKTNNLTFTLEVESIIKDAKVSFDEKNIKENMEIMHELTDKFFIELIKDTKTQINIGLNIN